MEPRSFRQEQRGVALGMAGAAILAIVTVAAALMTADAWLQPPPTSTARAVWALRLQVFVLPWLAMGIADVARRRFLSLQHIAGAAGDSTNDLPLGQAKAVLQNSLEQVVLASGAQLIFAATAQGVALAAIPACAALFCLGRALFWSGYSRGARARALGFGLSFYPSVALLVASAVMPALR